MVSEVSNLDNTGDAQECILQDVNKEEYYAIEETKDKVVDYFMNNDKFIEPYLHINLKENGFKFLEIDESLKELGEAYVELSKNFELVKFQQEYSSDQLRIYSYIFKPIKLMGSAGQAYVIGLSEDELEIEGISGFFGSRMMVNANKINESELSNFYEDTLLQYIK